MSFNKLRKTPETPAAATPTVEPPTAAKVETTNHAVALFGGARANALMAVTDQADAAQAGQLIFPIIQISGGKTGGMFAPIDAVPQEIADQLPQGKKPIEAVFLTYRVEASAWAQKYGDGEQSRPLWSAAASNQDPALGKMIEKAARNYHYTKGDDKDIFDAGDDGSGVGHVRASLAILVYLPATDSLVVIQTPAHYPSWTAASVNLKKCADKDGVLQQFPVKLSVVSTQAPVNGYTVHTHALDFDKKIDPEGKVWYDKATKFLGALAQDEELKAQVNSWVNGEDKPTTDEIREKLAKAGVLKA